MRVFPSGNNNVKDYTHGVSKIIWVLPLIISVLYACVPKVTPVEITVHNPVLLALDEIKIQVPEQVIYDGIFYDIENYEWSIEDESGQVIKNDFPDAAFITWIPQKLGEYVILVDIKYNDSEGVTSSKEIQVLESPKSLQYKLAGEWEGHANRSTSGSWDLIMRFDSTGRCNGEVTNNYGTGSEGSIFGREGKTGTLHGDCANAGDCECQGIYIDGISDDNWIGRVELLRTWLWYNGPCYNACECLNHLLFLEEIRIDRSSDELYIKLASYDSDYIEYNLKRR